MGEIDVADFVAGVDVVDLADDAFVENCVEGVGGVGGEEVAAGVVPRSRGGLEVWSC